LPTSRATHVLKVHPLLTIRRNVNATVRTDHVGRGTNAIQVEFATAGHPRIIGEEKAHACAIA